MTADLVKFDTNTIINNVRDRIKMTFASLIPDEQWTSMIQVEVDKFFKIKDQTHHEVKRVSDFTSLVVDVLKEHASDRIQEFLEKYASDVWHGSDIAASEKLRTLIINNAKDIFLSVFESSFQNVINSMRDR